MAIGARAAGILEEIARQIGLGRPEEVAERIAEGRLDMRPEAVAERRSDFTGLLNPPTYYKGSGERYRAPLIELEDRSKAFFATPDPMLANSYIEGTGMVTTGGVYPLNIDTRDFATVDARGQSYQDIFRPTLFDAEGYTLIDSGRMVDPRITNGYDDSQFPYSTDHLAAAARRADIPGVLISNVVDLGANYGSLDRAMQQTEGLRASDYIRRLDEQGSGVVAVNPDAGDGMNKVRSLFAAFDPEYKGSNILGERAIPVAGAGLLAAAAMSPEEAEAGPLSAAARAAQQGFTNKQYHGSMQDFSEIIPDRDGLFFTTPNPDFASDWTGKGKLQDREGELSAFDRFRPQKEKLYEDMGSPEFGTPEYDKFVELVTDIYRQEHNAFKTVYPLLARTEKTFDPEKNFDDIADLFDEGRLNAPFSAEYPTFADALKGGNYILYENPEVVGHLKSKGYDSMFLRESTGSKEAREAPYTTVAHFYPDRNIRSQFAEFAEGYTGPNILGGTAAGALGLTALMAPEEAEAKTPEFLASLPQLEPYEPGIVETAVQNVAQFLKDIGATESDYTANQMASSLSNLADFTPVIGDAKGFAEARDAFSEGNYGEAAILGGLGLLGLIPVGGDILAGAAKGMFIGPSARNFNFEQMRRHQEMEEAGKSQREILAETGLFRGADGRVRSEISDATAKSTPFPFGQYPTLDAAPIQTTVGGILEHPELFRNYPFLQDVKVNNMAMTDPGTMHQAGGYYDPKTGELTLNPIAASSEDATRNIMLHELQHMVQQAEGFAKGGNAESAQRIAEMINFQEFQDAFDYGLEETAYKRTEILDELRALRPAETLYRLQNINRPKDLFNSGFWYQFNGDVISEIGPPPRRGQASLDYAQRAGKVISRLLQTKGYEQSKYAEGQKRLDEVGSDIKRLTRNAEAKLKRYDANPKNQEAISAVEERKRRNTLRLNETEQETYNRLGGEVESRNTEARQAMTMEERLATPYYLTQDIPNREQEMYRLTDRGHLITYPERNRFDLLYPRGLLGE